MKNVMEDLREKFSIQIVKRQQSINIRNHQAISKVNEQEAK